MIQSPVTFGLTFSQYLILVLFTLSALWETTRRTLGLQFWNRHVSSHNFFVSILGAHTEKRQNFSV